MSLTVVHRYLAAWGERYTPTRFANAPGKNVEADTVSGTTITGRVVRVDTEKASGEELFVECEYDTETDHRAFVMVTYEIGSGLEGLEGMRA